MSSIPEPPKDSDTLQIVSMELCPYAQRTRILLNLKEIPFQLTEIDLANKPGWLFRWNPLGKVPTIQHKGFTLYESSVINEYLEEEFPHKPVLPKGDTKKRALARLMIERCNSALTPPLYGVMMSGGTDEKQKEALVKVLEEIDGTVLTMFGEGPFFLGDQVSLVDITYAPFFERMQVNEALGYVEFSELKYPNIFKHISAMRSIPAYAKTETPMETLVENYKRYIERRRQQK